MARIHTSGKTLVTDDHTFQFASAREAVEALKWVRQMDGYSVSPCSWLVQAPPVWASDPDSDWYPDSPADLVRDCGAPLVATDRGWECLHGHSHVSGAQYFEEEEVRHLMQDGYLVPQDALFMDGRPVF